MKTAPYPAWDNQQVAHFLCRADRRVLSQPHSWLHAGVGALEIPAKSRLADFVIKSWGYVRQAFPKIIRQSIIKVRSWLGIAIMQVLVETFCPPCAKWNSSMRESLKDMLEDVFERFGG